MSAATASKLDINKFRKVHRMMSGGATDGERSAARARAEVMAARAGMSLADAVSKLDSKPAAKPAGFFDGFDDAMEKKHPGWKAEEARKKAERNARDTMRKAEILAQYGSEAALFARTEQEALLSAAIAPLVTSWDSWTDDEGTVHRFAETIEGRRPKFVFWHVEDMTPAIQEAVRYAYPWPSKLDDALQELKAWDRLRWDRGLVSGDEWTHYAEVECRYELLELALKTSQPAATWDDVQARFDWKRYDFERQWIDPTECDDPFMDRLEADFALLRQQAEAGATMPEKHTAATPLAPRTNAEKRAAVLSMLGTHPELSDREIARRIGVSPQTVNTWRRKQSG